MSHFTVIVALRPTDPERVHDALAEALAPFDESREVTPYFEYQTGEPGEYWSVDACREKDLLPAEGELTWQQVAEAVNIRWDQTPDSAEYMHFDSDGRPYTISSYNPQSKWDWWTVGGRWTGYFTPVADRASDPRLITGTPGVFGTPAPTGHVDGGPRGLLDFEGLRAEKAAAAGAQYDAWTTFVDGLPEALPWSHFYGRHEADKDAYPIDQARKDYNGQPRVTKARQSRDFAFLDCVIETFSPTRDEYMQRAADRAVPGYAFLGLDGVWQAPGEMGWFGMSSDDESDRAAHYRRMNEYLDALDPSVLLVAVDCHI
jgi:hypothetical protein